MNYKKSILSVVLWFIYAIIAGTGLVGTTMVMLLPEGGSRPIGLVIAGIWLAVTGLVVFLLHRLFGGSPERQKEDRQKVLLILEGMLFVALLAVGIVLRTREVMLYDAAGDVGNVWFEAAKVTETTQIPQVVHGAVYFYLQVLHGLLVLLGNKMTAALILQAVIQILTGIFFYFAVRRLTGAAGAVVTLGCFMLSPLLSDTVILGPEPLYLLLWSIGLCVSVGILAHFQQKGDITGLGSLIGFFFGGVAIGVLGYLDIMGFLLLLILFSVLFLEAKQAVGILRRISAAFLGLSGTLGGFFLSIALDAVGSGKLMGNVLLAWWRVYTPEKFSLAVTYTENVSQGGTFPVIAAIFTETLFCIGAFSYWCRKKWERQTIWVAVMVALGILICVGMTGEEMQGRSLLTLLVVTIGGAGVQAILPYTTRDELLQTVVEAEVMSSPKKRRLKVQDLETEELPEEAEPLPEETVEMEKICLIENPLPLPKKHVPKVLDYKLDNDEEGDFDYPVADDDDFDL